MNWRGIRCVGLVLLATALASVSHAASTPAATGFFTVRVVNHAPFVNIFLPRFEKITVQAVEPKGKLYTIRAVNDGSLFHTLFQTTLAYGGRLPEGRYRLASMIATGGTMSSEMRVGEALPPFDVAAGAVTDLGILVFQPTGAGKGLVIPIADVDSTASVLQRQFPAEAQAFVGHDGPAWPAAAGWKKSPVTYGDVVSGLGLIADLLVVKTNKDAQSKDITGWDKVATLDEAIRAAKASTLVHSAPAIMSDGSVLLGSTLGRVLQRAPDGHWEEIDTGLLAEISAVTRLPDGTLVAGTEYGDFYRRAPGEAAFARIASSPDRWRIVDVRRLAGDRWLVATRGYDRVKDVSTTNVYVAESLEKLPATPVTTVSQNSAPTFSLPARLLASTQATPTGYFVGVERIESARGSPDSGAWTKVAGKEALRIVANNAGDVLYTQFPPQFSVDQGHTWNAVTLPARVFWLLFFDASNAIFMTLKSGDEVFMATHDSGKTWSTVNTLPKSLCLLNDPWLLDVQRRLFCTFNDGGIYSFTESTGWTAERVPPH